MVCPETGMGSVECQARAVSDVSSDPYVIVYVWHGLMQKVASCSHDGGNLHMKF